MKTLLISLMLLIAITASAQKTVNTNGNQNVWGIKSFYDTIAIYRKLIVREMAVSNAGVQTIIGSNHVNVATLNAAAVSIGGDQRTAWPVGTLSIQTNGTIAASGLTNVNLVTGTGINIGVFSNLNSVAIAISASVGSTTNDFWNESGIVIGSANMSGWNTGLTIVNDAGASVGNESASLSPEQLPVFFCTTGTTSNRNSSVKSDPPSMFGFPTRFLSVPSITTIVNRRIWLGMTTGNAATMMASDSPATEHVSFRLSAMAGDTNWMAVVSDGSLTTISNTGVAIGNTVRYVGIEWNNITNGASFYINGNLVAVLTNTINSGQTFGMFMGVRNNTNRNVTARASYIKMWQNPFRP